MNSDPILIVDDEPTNLATLRQILKEADSTPKCNPSCHAAFGKDSAKKTE